MEKTPEARWIYVAEREFYCEEKHCTIETTDETCSQCHERTIFIGNKWYIQDNYCPACGAQMRQSKR